MSARASRPSGVSQSLGRLLTVAQLAEHLSVSTAFVYEHANELAVIRIGSGPRPALRFDLGRTLDAVTARESSERSDLPERPRPLRSAVPGRPPSALASRSRPLPPITAPKEARRGA